MVKDNLPPSNTPVRPPFRDGVKLLIGLTPEAARLVQFFAPVQGMDEWISQAIIDYVDNSLAGDEAALTSLEDALERVKAKLATIDKILLGIKELKAKADRVRET